MVMVDCIIDGDRARGQEIKEKLKGVALGDLFDYIEKNLMDVDMLIYREHAIVASSLVMMAFLAHVRPKHRDHALNDIIGSLVASMNASLGEQALADSTKAGNA